MTTEITKITEQDKQEFIEAIKKCKDLEGIMIVTPRGKMYKGWKITEEQNKLNKLERTVKEWIKDFNTLAKERDELRKIVKELEETNNES